jgi:Holliday junction resolvase RusA-like endonuclease
MEPLFFSMAGMPRGKGRPRVFTQGGRSVATTDPKTRQYEASVTELARRAMGEQSPFEGPLSVSIRFRMPIPASASKRAKAAMAAGEVPPVSKPDIDNMAKAILDGMGEDAKRKKAGMDARVVFRSDAQIVRLFLTKEYAEKPGVDVRVEALAEPTP